MHITSKPLKWVGSTLDSVAGPFSRRAVEERTAASGASEDATSTARSEIWPPSMFAVRPPHFRWGVLVSPHLCLTGETFRNIHNLSQASNRSLLFIRTDSIAEICTDDFRSIYGEAANTYRAGDCWRTSGRERALPAESYSAWFDAGQLDRSGEQGR